MRRLLGVMFVIGFIIIMANTQHYADGITDTAGTDDASCARGQG